MWSIGPKPHCLHWRALGICCRSCAASSARPCSTSRPARTCARMRSTSARIVSCARSKTCCASRAIGSSVRACMCAANAASETCRATAPSAYGSLGQSGMREGQQTRPVRNHTRRRSPPASAAAACATSSLVSRTCVAVSITMRSRQPSHVKWASGPRHATPRSAGTSSSKQTMHVCSVTAGAALAASIRRCASCARTPSSSASSCISSAVRWQCAASSRLSSRMTAIIVGRRA
mmetsp:Transcript_223/g.577  ORF Transcript_223/g.577 Transcript_223/m.577 type:complete len:234 (+) Transcript_223:1367-2068(+)